jgi:hypothetical protein
MQVVRQYDEAWLAADEAEPDFPTASPEVAGLPQLSPAVAWSAGLARWPTPSSLCADPDQARARIPLLEFEPLLLEKARVISGYFPTAEAQYRYLAATEPRTQPTDLPHFERVFRLASALAGVTEVETAPDYDALLVLTAWHSVRPAVEGFLGSYPKALLCPLSHCAPPAALASLSPRERGVFERRAPAYLRYLLCDKLGLRTCADIENADLRHLLRSWGFRLVRSSAVAELAFPGITQGEDPPVRPWKLTLRQELSDERAGELLLTAALWKIKYDLRLVTFADDLPSWNIGAFARTDWEEAFLSLGVRVPPALLRDSGLVDWRAILRRCLEQLGCGNLPTEVLAKVAVWPQRICHDNQEAIWAALDQTARMVVERARSTEPGLFDQDYQLEYETARSFRGWGRLFDEVSPQMLSRFGVSAFTALRRVAPELFGWGPAQLKPWEVEQDFGKWKGPRGRALLRSAYAYALFDSGLGRLYRQEDQVFWQCTLDELAQWYPDQTVNRQVTPCAFLYRLASRHGLTPLLNSELTHSAAVSLLAGVNLHANLPKIEGCWELCLRAALEHYGGKLEVRLSLPDLVPLPLRLRKAVLARLDYSYLHKELRLVRNFDLQMARESHCRLEEVPGWWEDERILGTPLADRLSRPDDPARPVLAALWPDPWLETPAPRARFRALYLLVSRRATLRTAPGEAGLSSAEIRVLLRLALEAAFEHTNIVSVSRPAIRRGLERLLARDDTREMLDALLLHIGAAYETELWGHVRKLIVLDVINDLLALTIRSSLLHLLSSE